MTIESVTAEGDAAAAVLAETGEWQRIMALDAEKVLRMALMHDLQEAVTTDLPTPIAR